MTHSLCKILCLVCLLGLPLGAGLSGCKKKPPEAKQKDDSRAMPMDAMRPMPMDAMRPTPMDGMGGMNGWTMERPDPGADAGVADPKGNKGMMAMKQLEDPL